jgi:transcriptional regulator with XRE-family HTH domain
VVVTHFIAPVKPPNTWRDTPWHMWQVYRMNGVKRIGLIAARNKSGMSQQQAADELGVHISTYRKKESGERAMNEDFIKKACELFSVTPDQLVAEVSASLSEAGDQIDFEKLTTNLIRARQQLGAIPEEAAREVILALISASRRS